MILSNNEQSKGKMSREEAGKKGAEARWDKEGKGSSGGNKGGGNKGGQR